MSGEFDLSTVEPAAQLEAQLGTDETLEWVVEKHQRDVYFQAIGSTIGGLFLGFFLTIPGFFVAIIVTQDPFVGVTVAAALLVGVALLSGLWTLLKGLTATVQYAATDERFITLKDTLTGTTTNSVPIDRVRDVEYSEDATDKLFGTGDITVEPERGADPLVFDNVKDEGKLLRAIRQQADI